HWRIERIELVVADQADMRDPVLFERETDPVVRAKLVPHALTLSWRGGASVNRRSTSCWRGFPACWERLHSGRAPAARSRCRAVDAHACQVALDVARRLAKPLLVLHHGDA